MYEGENEQIRVQKRAGVLSSLQNHWGLTEPEAIMLADHMEKNPGSQFEYEKGSCRTCDGDGHTVEMGCMGGSTRTCPKCDGTGVDTMRLKVPGFVYECTCHPEWWDTAIRSERDRDRSQPKFHMHATARANRDPEARGRIGDVMEAEDLVQQSTVEHTPGDDDPPWDTFIREEIEDFKERNWDAFPPDAED
jgi:hypothetical protein